MATFELIDASTVIQIDTVQTPYTKETLLLKQQQLQDEKAELYFRRTREIESIDIQEQEIDAKLDEIDQMLALLDD